jgi:hypothetical protein
MHVDNTLILGNDWTSRLIRWTDQFSKAAVRRNMNTPQLDMDRVGRDYQMLLVLWKNFPGLTVKEMNYVVEATRNGINALPQLLQDLRKQGRYNPTF